MFEIKYILIAIIVIIVFGLIVFRKIRLLEAFVLLIPFKSISFDIGIELYLFQLPILFLVLKNALKINQFKFNLQIIIFLGYVVFSTFIISNFFIENFVFNKSSESFFRNEGRYISTLVKFVFLDFGALFLISNLLKSDSERYSLINKYLLSLIILCFFGLFQVIISIFFGIDIFPNENLRIENYGLVDVVDVFKDVLPFTRMTSLGGEPKNIACSLVVGVIIILFTKSEFNIIKYKKLKIILFVACIIFTLSTSGLALLILAFIFYLISNINKIADFKIKPINLLWFLFSIVFISFFYDFIYLVIESRILERSDELLNEEVDLYIQQFLIDNPIWMIFGSGSGNIHNLVSPLLKGNIELLDGGNIFASRYGYMKLISENGIIGFILFMVAFFKIIFQYAAKYKNKFLKLEWIVLILIIFFLLRGNYVFYELIIFVGIMSSYSNDNSTIKNQLFFAKKINSHSLR